VHEKIARRDVTAAEYNNNDGMHGLSNVTIANVWSFGNTANVLRTGFAARGQKAEVRSQKLGVCLLPSVLTESEFFIKLTLFLSPAPL